MTIIIEDDGDHFIVSPRTVAFCQANYWVCAFKPRWNPAKQAMMAEPCYWWDWVFNQTQPPPVPNPQMEWRRPTYAEIERRQQVWLERRDDFEREVEKAAQHHLPYHHHPRPLDNGLLRLSDIA